MSRSIQNIPHHFLCPITNEVMKDPYMCADGHSFEKEAIDKWLADNSTNPVTGKVLSDKTVKPNHALREAIKEFFDDPSLKKPKESASSSNSMVAGQSSTLPSHDYITEALPGEYLIHVSIRNRDVETLKFLVKDENLCLTNSEGLRPIDLAVKLGYWDLVICIAENYSLNEYKDKGIKQGFANALASAITLDQQNVIQSLLKKRTISVVILNQIHNGKTAIELAAELGKWESVIYIAQQCSYGDFSTLMSPYQENTSYGTKGYENVLRLAVNFNKQKAIHALLKAGTPAHTKPLRMQPAPAKPSQSAVKNVVLFKMEQSREIPKPKPRSKSCVIC